MTILAVALRISVQECWAPFTDYTNTTVGQSYWA